MYNLSFFIFVAFYKTIYAFMHHFTFRKILLTILSVFFMLPSLKAQDASPKILQAKKLNETTVELTLDNSRHILIDFYGKNIFRMFEDSTGKSLRKPYSKPKAQILVNDPRKPAGLVKLMFGENTVIISSPEVEVRFNKSNSLFKIKNRLTDKVVAEEAIPVAFEKSKTTLSLKEQPSEYFYGGGVQNGRFSHKGKEIAIVNENNWTDGGVASPTPFYWSTNGYGLLWYTFKKGKYDFGSKKTGIININHETNYLDVFFMIGDSAVALLKDYYQLTGHPVLIPKFGFYEGHLNAYNRDYWKPDSAGILFEDGKRYKESQKDNGGIKESLNGEKNNYQFSARAVIDRYKRNDMPLGWILPNDGYGAGYGQTSTLDSNILNLKNFGDYARKNGVQLGLWTQSDLHPKPGVSALLQRDIDKEVGEAGVSVLKTDVAWVGAGYSFGLHGIADVAGVTTKYGNDARPFIITLDGWAGTQRYAAVWTGDQTGGQWEYIRFHIPTYIGSGLSGEPNITSDMDGIFGGKKPIINARDFEWRTFTPMQLNMDGWGANPKYPMALGEPTTSINRNYLKLKSELLPYTYSIAHQAVNGLPLIRALFLEYPNSYTHGISTQYQFMYGPYFLVAPIYKNTRMDSLGNDIRNNIYLPKGNWIDYFTGAQFEGDRVLNYYDAPIWKLPVFVKPGAIIPMINANNNVTEINKALRIYELYPSGQSSFTSYDDDGTTEEYKEGQYVTTQINSELTPENVAIISINPSKGTFNGFVKEKTTLLKFNVSQHPGKITARIGGKKVRLKEAVTREKFKENNNVYYYDPAPNFNQFATKGSEFEKVKIIRNPQLMVKLAPTDITKNKIEVQVADYVLNISNHYKKKTGVLTAPEGATVSEKNTTSVSLIPSWEPVENADYYAIKFDSMLYTHIKDTAFLFSNLQPETVYSFSIRAVNKSGASPWVTVHAKTKVDPLEFALHNITGYCTKPAQEGHEINRLFDFENNRIWHTRYQEKAVPFDIVIDLKSVNKLDRIEYLPRRSGRNGIITQAEIYFSRDKKSWTAADSVKWTSNNDPKKFIFKNHPTARYIKISVTKAVGDYGSGRELYVFKVPGSTGFLPGDINQDGKIDENDLTSYRNYTGLRKGDADFEGYISKGDINKNGLIDAYDISNVATQLEGGVRIDSATPLSGKLILFPNKKSYQKGEDIEVIVKGKDLNAVNALSFALPYNTSNYEYLGLKILDTHQMQNMTNDRLHSDGEKVLYPTFVNIGNKETLNGTDDLFILKFRAKKNINFNLKIENGMLVDKGLEVVKF